MPYDLSACGLVTVTCLIATNNTNSDNSGHLAYYNNNTGVGSAVNAQLLGINKYGCGQYMMWEEKGMRIGLRSVTNSGCGDLYFTAGSDSDKMVIRCNGSVGIGLTNPGVRLHVRNCGITAGTGSISWPAYNIEDSTTSRVVCIDTEGNGNCATAGTGATVSLILGQYYDSRVVITPAGAGSGVPADQGTGYGRDLMVKGGYSDNTNGRYGGRLWLNGGMGYSGAFNTNVGNIIMQGLGGGGNVGIGTTSPSYRLQVCGNEGAIHLRVNSDGVGSNVHIRPNAGRCGWVSFTEDAVADRWGIGIKNGDSKLYFSSGNVSADGGTARMVLDSSGNVGIGTTSPNVMLQVAGNFTLSGGTRCIVGDGGDLLIDTENVSGRDIILQSNSGQKVGIGTTTPSYRLHVNGTFYAAGSSIKYKEGICNYDTNSCLFMCLKPVAYQYKDEFKHLGKELKADTQIGLIAEDVAEVMPELAVLVNEEDEKVVRNVDYEKLSIVLLSELQKLRKEVDELKNNK